MRRPDLRGARPAGAVAIVTPRRALRPFTAAMRRKADQLVITSRFASRDEGAGVRRRPRPTVQPERPGRAQPVAVIHAEFARQTEHSARFYGACCALLATNAGCRPLRRFRGRCWAAAEGGLQRHRAVQVRRLRLARGDAARHARRPPTCFARGRRRLAGRQHRRHRPGARHRGQRRCRLAGRRVLLIGAGGAARRAGAAAGTTGGGAHRDRQPHRAKAGNWSAPCRWLAAAAALRCRRPLDAGRLRRRHQRHRLQPAGAAACRRPACCPRRAGAGHDVRPGARRFMAWAAGARRHRPRRPGHAGRAGGAEAFLAWRGVRPDTGRCRCCAGARRAGIPPNARVTPRRDCWAGGWPAAVLCCFWRCRLYFLAAHRADAVVDPQSTTFQRSEIWRCWPPGSGRIDWASNGATTMGQPT